MIAKHFAKLGLCSGLGDVTEARILNRNARWASTKLTHDTPS